MKQSILIVGAIMLLGIHCPAADLGVPVTKEEVRSAITLFRQAPASPRGRAAGKMVQSFAEKDDSIIIYITNKVVPFLDNVKIPHEDRALLLAAFVVGNIDSQLLRNEKKDHPYDGVLEVIEVYRRMRARNPAVRIAEVEKFIDLEKRGELKQYVGAH
jgi:hypothetical protein